MLSGQRAQKRVVLFAILTLLAVSWMSAIPVAAAIPSQERQALLDLYSSTQGAAWTQAGGWNGAAGSECSWYGVTCDGTESHVVRLVLIDNHLDGPLPSSIGQLSELRALLLHNNELSGGLPATLGDLTLLDTVNLALNQLSGPIPNSLSQWTAVTQVLMEGNDLSGPIPAFLGDLGQLRRLILGGNMLSGTIPVELADLSLLEALDLSQNQLSGPIPPELGSLQHLQGLGLRGNDLTGSIPVELSDLSDLEVLRLGRNQLTGPIPHELGLLSQLQFLDLSDNALTGNIPGSLGQLTQLQQLMLNLNQLDGAIPPELYGLAALTLLDLSFNQLTGGVDAGLADLHMLQTLHLGFNQLTGTIPASLGQLQQLQNLHLDRNQLNGSIPPALADALALRRLSMTGNQLSGTIPAGLGGLADLEHLLVSSNQLTGTIPSELGQATALQILRTDTNLLSGPIPATLGDLSQLEVLGLSHNQLDGSIPSSLGQLTSLTWLDLRSNLLTGSVPSSLGALAQLQQLYLSSNDLSGALPSELGNLAELEIFEGAINHFEGAIPSSLANLAELRSLNLSLNRLEGSIPASLGDLSGLQDLYLRGNRLTAPLPASLQNLDGLEPGHLDLRHNLLETSDAALAAFLDTLHVNPWDTSQTVAPQGMAAVPAGSGSIHVTWDPIPYPAHGGGYRVSVATQPGGPYTFVAMTAGKTVDEMTLSGLLPDTTYYVVVQTRTDPHNGNESTLTSGFSAEVQATTAPAGLGGHWPLDDGAGGLAVDVSGNGNDGTLLGGPIWTFPTQLGGGLDFDGVDDYVVVPDPGSPWKLDLTPGFTLAVWIRPDALGNHQALVSKDNAFELEIGLPSADAYSLRLDNALVGQGATPLTEGLWHHLAVTYDGTSVAYYLNGVSDGAFSTSFPLIQNDVAIGFGARPPHGVTGPTFHFDGLMDDVQIYGRALSAAEVAGLVSPFGGSAPDLTPPQRSALAPASTLPSGTAQTQLTLTTDEGALCRFSGQAEQAFDSMTPFSTSGGSSHATTVHGLQDEGVYAFYVRCMDDIGNINPEAVRIAFGVSSATDLGNGLLASWALDEGTGCAALDDASVHDGVLGPACPGVAPQWVAGRVGSGLRFDGTGLEVAVADHPAFASFSEMTLSAWIRHDSTTSFKAIVDRRSQGTVGFDLFLNDQSQLFVRFGTAVLHGQQGVADGQWHHVAAVFDGSDLVLYVDGLEDRRQTVGAVTVTTSAPLYLGRYFDSPGQFGFAGDLDEVRVYDRGLSPTELLEVFQLAP